MRLNLNSIISCRKVQSIFFSNNGWQGLANNQLSEKLTILEIQSIRNELGNKYEILIQFQEENKHKFPMVCRFISNLRDKTVDYHWMYETVGSNDYLFMVIDPNKEKIHNLIGQKTMKESIQKFITLYREKHEELKFENMNNLKKFIKNPFKSLNLE